LLTPIYTVHGKYSDSIHTIIQAVLSQY